MSVHRVVPVNRAWDDPPTQWRWRCVFCGQRWMTLPERDDDCDTEDAS